LLRYDRHAILRSVNIHYTSVHIYVNGIGWKMLHCEWLFEW